MKLFLSLFILLIFTLTSCRNTVTDEEIAANFEKYTSVSEPKSGVVEPSDKKMKENFVDITGSDGIISSYAVNHNKYYFVTKKVKSSGYGSYKIIAYYDFQSGESFKICPDVLCNHKDPGECKYADLQDLYFTDTPGVFYSIYMNTRYPEIRKIDLNANTSKTLHVCSTLNTIIIGNDNNKLYFYEVEKITDKDKKETKEQKHLYYVDMKTEQVSDLGYFPEGFNLEFSMGLFVYKGELYYQAVGGRLMKTDMQFKNPTEIFSWDDGLMIYWFYDTNTDELFFNINNTEKNTGSVYVCRNGRVEKIDLPHEDIFTFTLTDSEIYYSTYDPVYYGISKAPGNPEVYDYSGGKIYKTSRTDTSQSELVYDCAGEYIICSNAANYYVFDNHLFFDELEIIRENIMGIEYTYFSMARNLNKICIDLTSGELTRIQFD